MELGSKNVAVVDIGSAKAKIVVASFEDADRYQILHRGKRPINIVSAMSEAASAIAPEAITRLTGVLDEYADILEASGVSRTRVIGTEAIRGASNADRIEGLIRAKLGSPSEVLSQQQEAQLFFDAVATKVDGNIAVADIGGGSVQVTVGSSEGIDQQAFMKTGTVALVKTFVNSDFPSSTELAAANEFIKGQVADADLVSSGGTLVYGSTNIIDFFRQSGIETVDRSNDGIHPIAASVGAIRGLYDEIVKYPYPQRDRFFPDDPSFMYGADMSLLNIMNISEALDVDRVVPTNLNLSDALLRSMA